VTQLTWIDVDVRVVAALRTAEDIRLHLDPTFEQYLAERAGGWSGSDGSTFSFDTNWFQRIGLTTADFRPDLPTWDHDLDYRAIRRMLACGLIDEEEAEKLRRAADEALLLRMFRKADEGYRILRPLRRRRAVKYFEGVHLGGRSSIRPRAGEWYPRLAPRAA
jgi:hypothetical protein